MDFFTRNNEFKDDGGPVRFIDGSALDRPLKVPWTFRIIMAVIVAVAAIGGGIFFFNVSDEINNAPLREAEATEAALNREVALNLPVLPSLVQLDDPSILALFTEAGYTIYDLNSANQAEGTGFDVIKLPEGVDLIDAGVLYSKGITNLSSSEAARLLNGSWRMTVSRSGYVSMSVKYADFTSGGVDAAVQNAIISQGLAESVPTDSGVDSAGNTFQSGQIDINGTIYQWRVSACPLLDFYSIDGLPDTGAYVGIRLYQ